jgi:RNA polymerase sigma-70 factor (ECF subfamily)
MRDYAAESNLRQSLIALPEDQRQVVVLHVWGELTFSEIADVLNVSPNTAASRYRYALAKLRDSMRGKAETHAKGKGEIS